jgi:hypothetical protein
MTDIIDRLRSEGKDAFTKQYSLGMYKLCDEAANRIERLEDALRIIAAWSEAYPLKVFPEPDLLKVRELLEAGGITLDSVSAHAMRHVVESVGKIAVKALAPSITEPQAAPEPRCARCGYTLNGEAAQVGDEIWCHPCADTAPLSRPQRD